MLVFIYDWGIVHINNNIICNNASCNNKMIYNNILCNNNIICDNNVICNNNRICNNIITYRSLLIAGGAWGQLWGGVDFEDWQKYE